jgi:MspA
VQLLRIGAGAAVLLCVSSAVNSGMAGADPLPVADVRQAITTEDGWHLAVSLTQMAVNSVPNMAATAFTREGFVTGRAEATIDGSGSSAVNSGTLIVGLQLGCQVDLSEGASVGGDATIGVNPGFSGNLLNAIGPYADLEGNVSVNLLPGTITNVVLGKKALKGRTGGITVHDAHVKVDACGGAVVIRFFSTVTIDTDKNDDSVNAYGDILQL